MLVTYDTEWRARREVLPAEMVATMAWAEGKTARDMARALVMLADGITLLRRLQGDAQCLLLPSAAQVPFAVDAPAPANQADFTVLANLAGAPAVSVPMPCAADQHPAGLQVIAAPGADMEGLALAAAYESALAR
jgi:aspartyl-tRNA(Asn)/glutamyl-tRNA(Gln) amidotransferase subunit A